MDCYLWQVIAWYIYNKVHISEKWIIEDKEKKWFKNGGKRCRPIAALYRCHRSTHQWWMFLFRFLFISLTLLSSFYSWSSFPLASAPPPPSFSIDHLSADVIATPPPLSFAYAPRGSTYPPGSFKKLQDASTFLMISRISHHRYGICWATSSTLGAQFRQNWLTFFYRDP